MATKTTTKKASTKKPSAKKVDKVDTTVEGDETKVKPSRSTTGNIRLDPNLALIPGNSVTFVAPAKDGRLQAKIITARDSWLVAASVRGDEARVSKILEVPGDITVEFYADGKKYASGSWTVG